MKIDIDWNLAGAYLANESDENQIKFFKTMVKEMKSWGTNYEIESQLAHVNLGLTKEERKILSMITYEEEKA